MILQTTEMALPWPVTKGYVCEQYGRHEHPAIKGFMMFNNGIEICTSMGSQARAGCVREKLPASQYLQQAASLL